MSACAKKAERGQKVMRPAILFPLFAEIRTLSGVGPRLETLIRKVAGPRLVDLAFDLPVDVIDRSYRPRIAEAEPGRIATLAVTVLDHVAPRVKSQPYKVRVSDETATMELVFFRAADAGYTVAAEWERVDAVLRHVVPRIAEQARRYVDERVVGQGAVEHLARTRETAQWRPPRPLIAADGRRLDARTPQTGIGPVVVRLAWFAFRSGLYLVPLVFAFAGFMSIVDGR